MADSTDANDNPNAETATGGGMLVPEEAPAQPDVVVERSTHTVEINDDNLDVEEVSLVLRFVTLTHLAFSSA